MIQVKYLLSSTRSYIQLSGMERCEKCNRSFQLDKIKFHKRRCPGLQCKICFQIFSNVRWVKRHQCPNHSLALRNHLTQQIRAANHHTSLAELSKLRYQLKCWQALQKAARLARELKLLKRHLRLNKQVCNTFLRS